MPHPPPRQLLIQGVTRQGRTFRPSDWAERLAGAMSSFRPGGTLAGPGSHIGYSPLCFPQPVGALKCVLVDERLREVEPMAWDFVMNFARDNELTVVDWPPAAASDRPGEAGHQSNRPAEAGP